MFLGVAGLRIHIQNFTPVRRSEVKNVVSTRPVSSFYISHL